MIILLLFTEVILNLKSTHKIKIPGQYFNVK